MLSTCLLTRLCRVLLQKLTGLQLVKKFPAFYGTRKFINALTSVRHCYLSWASRIQSTYSTSHFVEIHPNIIHPSTPRSHKMCYKIASYIKWVFHSSTYFEIISFVLAYRKCNLFTEFNKYSDLCLQISGDCKMLL